MGYSTQTGLFRGSWLQTVRYYRNDSVVFSGAFYAATEDNINFAPSAKGAPWEPISQANVGDMFTSVYDPTKSGKVLKASMSDSAPWTGLSNVPPIVPQSLLSGPIFFLGASWEDEENYAAQQNAIFTGPNYFSNGYSWAHIILANLGQNTKGRSAVDGKPPNPLGQIYAIGGTLSNGLPAQITTLSGDYPTLPANSIVVIGSPPVNDLNLGAVQGFGGVWTTTIPVPTWQVSPTGGFTSPASGTFTVNVVSTTGMVAGSTNGLVFQLGGAFYGPFFINTVTDSTHVLLNANPSVIGTFPNNTAIKMGGAYSVEASVGYYSNAVTSLLSILPASGLIVCVLPPNLGLLAGFSGNATLQTQTWNYWRYYFGLGLVAPTSQGKVAMWDQNTVFSDVLSTYGPTQGVSNQYGFKLNAGYGQSAGNFGTPIGNQNYDDYPFCDTGVHPSGAMHRIIAQRFMQTFLRPRGYISG